MGTKQQPSVWDCHGDALPDEPLFTLLARDPQAPKLVRKWAHDRAEIVARGHAPITDAVKVAEAYELAQKMEVWRARRRESNPPMVEGEGRRSPVDSLEDIHSAPVSATKPEETPRFLRGAQYDTPKST